MSPIAWRASAIGTTKPASGMMLFAMMSDASWRTCFEKMRLSFASGENSKPGLRAGP